MVTAAALPAPSVSLIQFTIDGVDDGPGYVLRAEGASAAHVEPLTICSDNLEHTTAIGQQARELVDAAAALIESLPEFESAFESLHEALDSLPTREG